MQALLLFQDWNALPWDKLVYGAQGVMVLAIILIFFLRIAPTWRDVKMRELDVRQAEAVASGQQAESQRAIADVLFKVAIEQRRASDSVKILQRVNTTKADDLESAVSEVLENHEKRLSKVEKNDAHSITAN